MKNVGLIGCGAMGSGIAYSLSNKGYNVRVYEYKNNKNVDLLTKSNVKFVGMEELIKTLIVGAVSGIVAYMFYLFTGKTIIATLIVIGAIVVSVVSLIKGSNNFSMVDTIKNILKFETMQKEYRYKIKNE